MMGSKRRQALLAAFDRLDQGQQDALMDFAAVLAGRDDIAAPAVMRTEPRPSDESVVAAIKRLTRVYPAASADGAGVHVDGAARAAGAGGDGSDR